MFFIDFQTLSIGHPSKDFWYFLYCSTDSKWRKEHLEECFETYFNTFQTYLKQARIEVTYEEFKIEFLGMVSNKMANFIFFTEKGALFFPTSGVI